MNFKKIKLIWVLCAVQLISVSSFAQNKLFKIAFLPQEKWYGGLVGLGTQMPYNKIDWQDLGTNNRNNQTSPLFISNKGRVVWLDKAFKFKFNADTLYIESQGETPQVLQTGKNLKEAFLTASKNFFPPDGKTPLPIFFNKPQYNTWIELAYHQNQKDIMNYATQIQKNGLSEGVIMIDDNWQRYYGNYDFKAEEFPDAKGMIQQLHDMGFKVMVWICPYISPDCPEFRDLESKGLLVKDKNGETAIVHWWNGFSAMYDLTNPKTQAYLKETLQNAQKKYGIDGFKFDGADVGYMKPNAYQFFDKNAQNPNYTEKWAEFALNFPYNELRATWKQGGKALIQRLGDKSYSWDAVAQLVPDMMIAGLMGYPYTCPDMIGGGQIGSFNNLDQKTINQELIVRSCQTHALMPMMQFSVAPWRILDQEHLNACIKATKIHEKMAPTFEKLAIEASKTGLPIIRNLDMEFPNQGFENCKDQFLIGDKILVAPMLKAGNQREIKLPKGNWVDENGKKYTGSKTYTIQVPLDRIPYFTLK